MWIGIYIYIKYNKTNITKNYYKEKSKKCDEKRNKKHLIYESVNK